MARWYLLFPGTLFAIGGFVFFLQGMGIVGPTSSFMFHSRTWIFQGTMIFLLGLIMVITGFFWRPRLAPKTGAG